jgi:hypothetical protein
MAIRFISATCLQSMKKKGIKEALRNGAKLHSTKQTHVPHNIY